MVKGSRGTYGYDNHGDNLPIILMMTNIYGKTWFDSMMT